MSIDPHHFSLLPRNVKGGEHVGVSASEMVCRRCRFSPRNSWACLLDRGSNVDEFRENGEMSIVFISIYGKFEGVRIDRIFAICRNITKEIICWTKHIST